MLVLVKSRFKNSVARWISPSNARSFGGEARRSTGGLKHSQHLINGGKTSLSPTNHVRQVHYRNKASFEESSANKLLSDSIRHEETAGSANELIQVDSPSQALGEVSQVPAKSFKHSDYTVGWICALPIEMTAAKAMLDEVHLPLPNAAGDLNAYQLGAIGEHNVVITCIRSGVYGTTSATATAIAMRTSYPRSVTAPLLVGIAGGVPRPESSDIRLGDVVVSTPSPRHPAVLQYDYGKREEDELRIMGSLNKPAPALLNALSNYQSELHLRGTTSSRHISHTLERYSLSQQGFSRPPIATDVLFEAEYKYLPASLNYESDSSRTVERKLRSHENPVIHFGCVASGNQVIKHAETRDRITDFNSGILCFEMEAAGVMDYMQCLVIRGICDYCDSNKSKEWQGYAALAAAATAKEILAMMPPQMVYQERMYMDDTEAAAERRKNIVNALKFDGGSIRRAAIRHAHPDTCQWLWRQPQILSWIDPAQHRNHHGMLWIKGKAGTGKSTIMKYLAEQTESTFSNNPGVTVVSFFFNARGVQLGRSVLGMYRSILAQIFEQMPSLQGLLDAQELSELGSPSEWPMETFEGLLQQIVKTLDGKQLVCFIDALDECPEDEIRDMVVCFERLANSIDENQFFVCFASRHYPFISLRNSCEFTLETQDGHSQDLLNYLDQEVSFGDKALTTELKTRVYAKSGQIFLWVVLVVQILKREYDRGGVHKLLALLEQAPTQVQELFRDILTKDINDSTELVTAIQWTLYARRSLRVQELYHAMLHTTSNSSLRELSAIPVTEDDMYRYILSRSKGILEQTSPWYPRIQFIHESVREFLLQPTAFTDLCPGFKGISEGETHEHLKNLCLSYIEKACAEISYTSIRKDSYPFMPYAVEHLLSHAERAQQSQISQKDFLQNFDLVRWRKLHTLMGQYHLSLRHSAIIRALSRLNELQDERLKQSIRLGCALAVTKKLHLFECWLAEAKNSPDWNVILLELIYQLNIEQDKDALKILFELEHDKTCTYSSVSCVDRASHLIAKETEMYRDPEFGKISAVEARNLKQNITRILLDLRSHEGYILSKATEL